ncbi:YqkE family protein [Bacillus sp. B1-b2]|uniref:YqkE family protein n=1 Tax=Bacillus sp. B1-b2 TaxID=2653201 RepID=UPI001261ADE8|nr:YqkE family protein [Bacillus sp. B1-b2]KAB7667110.1 YqkE family protein [Bacillus sp. B1-b2]
MAKQRKPVKKEQQDKPVTLGDLLNEQLTKQLKEKKQELKEQEEVKVKAEEERKREEKRQKEKNKSFEELLNENPMNWKSFK